MKRKIFSITLAILLILSSLGGLTAFAEATATEVSATAPTTFGPGSTKELGKGKSLTYDLNVSEAGYYGVTLSVGSPTVYFNNFNVYLNDATDREANLFTGRITEKTSQIGVIYLEKGAQKFKIESNTSTAGLKTITLDPTITTTVSDEAATTFRSNYSDEIEMVTWWSGDGYLEMAQGDYVVYDVNVLDGCGYNIKLNLASMSVMTGYFKVYVDGSTSYENLLYTGGVSSDALSTLGNIQLSKGSHTIKVECYAGNAYLKSVTLDFSTYLNSDKNEFGNAHRASSTGTYYKNDQSRDGSDYKSTEGMVQLTNSSTTNEIVYNVYATEAGNYLLSTYQGNKNYSSKFDVTVNGVEVFSNVAVPQTEKTTFAAKGNLGVIALNEGKNTIKLNFVYGDYGYFYGICLEVPEDPEASIAIYEGGLDSTTEATGITNGTMSVKVDLNGTTEAGKDALVIFAIYESDGTEYTRLHGSVVIPVAAANLAETAQGSISGISQVSGCTYTAKVFIWDATTIMGDVVNFFN